MEDMTPFDVVAFLFLVGWFILGYFQGLTRRVFGILGVVFALVVAAQVRQSLGDYLAGEWQNAPPEYSDMVAFGAVFLAIWIAVTIGIQLFYRPVPLLSRYPVLDELIGGVLGVLEGGLLLAVLFLVTDPYFASQAGATASTGEFGLFRSLHDFVNGSLTASLFRDQLIPNVFAIVGGLFPQDVVNTFKAAIAQRVHLA